MLESRLNEYSLAAIGGRGDEVNATQVIWQDMGRPLTLMESLL